MKNQLLMCHYLEREIYDELNIHTDTQKWKVLLKTKKVTQ